MSGKRSRVTRKLEKKWDFIRDIKIEFTNEKITDTTGLGPVIDIFNQSPLAEKFKRCLPERNSSRSIGNYKLALVLMASIIYGHDSLDDLEEFRGDPYLEKLFDCDIPAPRTMGDFLRDFTEENISELNSFLHRMAMSLRKQLQIGQKEEYKPGPPIFDIDSTDHVQSGDKMEGLAINYKGHWCLDSQTVFDEIGLNHGAQLRPGNTKSGDNSKELIENVFRGLKFKDKKYLRSDSAYCIEDVIRTCLSRGAFFTITAHGNIGWEEKARNIEKWVSWEYSEETLRRYEKKGKEPPKVELGRIHWSPGWAPQLKFPVIVKRTWKEKEQLNLFEEVGWKYYGVVTNFNLFNMTYQSVLEHHQKRGAGENFIREEKYGYDLKHFPCRKLNANHAYLLLAMVAHNILRWIAVMTEPEKPHFSKKLRRRFIFIPGKVVEHARQLLLKIPLRYREEVSLLREALQATHIPALEFS